MREYLFPLKGRKEVAEDTYSFYFDTTGTDFSYLPGQYAAFTLQNETKVFTLASSPHHKDFVMMTTRMRPSPFKEDLKKIPIGTPIKISPARGRFVLPNSTDKPLVFIAGGIGVTPFRSMIEWAIYERLSLSIALLYSNHTLKGTAFLEEFQTWAKQNPNFRFIPTLTREKTPSWPYEEGRIDEEKIKKYVKELERPIYYIAGPPTMVDSMRELLLKIGIPQQNIKIEKFSGY